MSIGEPVLLRRKTLKVERYHITDGGDPDGAIPVFGAALAIPKRISVIKGIRNSQNRPDNQAADKASGIGIIIKIPFCHLDHPALNHKNTRLYFIAQCNPQIDGK